MRYILLYTLCLFIAGCTRDVSEVPEATDSGNWLPVLTRAAVGTEATIAGFSSEASANAAFSQDVVCKDAASNRWEWKSSSASPSLNGIALLTASIPPINMSHATVTLNQSNLSAYSYGLQLGTAPVQTSENAVNAINVHHCLAQLDLDCEGTYYLNNTIDLYLAPSATIDFRTATIKTASYKTRHTQSLEDNRRIVLTILPQTFKKGDILFQYWHDNTRYTYYMERDLEVNTNQRLKVRISRGEEDKYEPGGGGEPDPPTPPDPPATVEISVTTSTITEWVQGSGSEVPVN
ncbi:fimbrillin family protein [Bacteroides sp.]|uniref:fimbrillin family protein n=1 Tax=Bacteroides sp. TaxID=29523 RepID=UPI003AB3228F